ncbi:hypothetical protein D3C74_419190 [compost metagenome]
MSLHPAQTLSGRRLESERLLIEHLGIIVEFRVDAFGGAAHGEFQILYQACCPPAHFFQQGRLKAHAGSAKEVRHLQIVARQLP